MTVASEPEEKSQEQQQFHAADEPFVAVDDLAEGWGGDLGWDSGGTGGTPLDDAQVAPPAGHRSWLLQRIWEAKAKKELDTQNTSMLTDRVEAVDDNEVQRSRPAEDGLEAMVEELVGVSTYRDVWLEDAVSKVDAAREALDALSKADSTSKELTQKIASEFGELRKTAPAFVPGQQWSGRQMSGFQD